MSSIRDQLAMFPDHWENRGKTQAQGLNATFKFFNRLRSITHSHSRRTFNDMIGVLQIGMRKGRPYPDAKVVNVSLPLNVTPFNSPSSKSVILNHVLIESIGTGTPDSLCLNISP